jgi:hypothetical protein
MNRQTRGLSGVEEENRQNKQKEQKETKEGPQSRFFLFLVFLPKRNRNIPSINNTVKTELLFSIFIHILFRTNPIWIM